MNQNFNFPYNNNTSNYQRNYYAFVNGLDGAKNYPIIPNQTMMLMDNDSPVCFMKSADVVGKTSLKCFKLVEIEEKELIKTPISSEDTQTLKEEITSINKRIDDLIKLIKKENKKEVENNA